MRQKFLIFFSIIIFTAINYAIYEKEQLIANGETILLELAAADPRSLMQGDYMHLRYSLQASPTESLPRKKNQEYMVIKPDENKVAKFIRFHKGEDLNINEKLLAIKNDYRRIKIMPNSFFFQEGHRIHYSNAKFAVFKFSSTAGKPEHMLIGLADEDRQLIIVD